MSLRLFRHLIRNPRRYLTAVLAALGLVMAGTPAHAVELSAEMQALLGAADARHDAEGFRETAELIAGITPGGRADVLAAITSSAPHRLAQFADWQTPAPVVAAAVAETPAVPDGEAAITAEIEPETRSWAKLYMDRLYSVIDRSAWSGRVSLGLQYVSGNSQLADYAFALHLNRDLNADWDLASKLEYFYTESDGAITRDNWLAEARLDRTIEGPWGAYGGANLERDELGNFRDTAFLTGGVSYHAVERETLDWQLRAGAGARYVDPDRPGQDADTSMVGELGSVLAWVLSDSARIGAETTLFAGDAARVEQRLGLVTVLREAWSLDTAIRARHEFEPAIGSEATDTRFTVSLGRDF